MAHQINFDERKGTHSFASNSEKAWHGLGQVVQTAMTSAQAIELANLDYEVGKTTIHAAIPSKGVEIDEETYYPEHLVKINDKFATYRADNNQPLGIVGARYEIVQNKDAFAFFDAIIDSKEAIFETAGALGNGERIFVTAKLPQDLLVKGEECNKYIILTNSHDGTSSIVAGFSTIRVVCNNTLQAALKGLTNKVYIEHRVGAKERLSEAYKVMGIASKYMTEVDTIFNQMAQTKISDTELQKYITDVMMPEYKVMKSQEEDEKISTRFKNQVISIYEFALSHPTQQTEATRGTLWGAYNSISGYYNYIQKYKNDEQKFTSQMFGNGNNKIQKGFQKAYELI
jgi:phage/plasmid-like protein (TIGR03299 family)